MLENLFRKFELPPLATKVYLQLLENGPVPAGKLSRKLSIPRSSLYGLLNNLLEQGLIGESEQEGVKIWFARPPAEISRLLSQKVNDWQKLQETFATTLINLESRQYLDFSIPKFQVFEGIAGVKQILRDLLLYRDLATQTIWPAKDMLAILGAEFHHELNLLRIRQNIYTQAIWPPNKVVQAEEYPFLGTGPEFKREIRQAPERFATSMGYWAYADKVAFVSSQKECFGFLVESRELRQLLKSQFQIIWELATPLNFENKLTREFLKQI